MNALHPKPNHSTRKRRSNTDLTSKIQKSRRLEDEGQELLLRGDKETAVQPPVNATPISAERKESLDNDESAPEGCILHASKSPKTTVYYFFYDALMFPGVLREVLRASNNPKIRDAKVTGYSLESPGQHTAITRGNPNEEVLGQVFQVYSRKDEYKLAWYQRSTYSSAPCLIQLINSGEPRQVYELAFMFNNKDGKIQMGNDNYSRCNDPMEDLADLVDKLKIARHEKNKQQDAIGHRKEKPLKMRVRRKWCCECEESTPEKGGECRYCSRRGKEEWENGPSCITIRSVEGLFDS